MKRVTAFVGSARKKNIYYYPTRLDLPKKVAGKLFDTMAVRKGLA